MYARTKRRGEFSQSRFVVFRERIFDRGDRIFFQPATEHLAQAIGIEFHFVQADFVVAGAAEFTRGDVERDDDLFARNQSGFLDRP